MSCLQEKKWTWSSPAGRHPRDGPTPGMERHLRYCPYVDTETTSRIDTGKRRVSVAGWWQAVIL